MNAHDFTFETLDGRGEIALRDFAGHAVLVVNTASFCGFTPQYADLEALWQRYRDQGLVVLGVPSNDFGAQEPGSAQDIADFCAANYSTSFPMTAKVPVIGGHAHPLYAWIAGELGEDAAPKWNFHKYLIGPDGELAGAWPSKVAPLDDALTQAVEAALAG
ncbi:MAG: glutathione peroxidase [Alphaproteobacteria bacterium]|nr:glutathione peroxidase [Alphaproteobacteria bacterium]